MANFVIKRDGTKEPFDAEKIKKSIATAAQMANLSEEKIKDVVDQVSSTAIQFAEGKEEVATTELREKILSELDTIEPSVSEAWRKYDQEKGRA
ncbi:MAG: ATP cone domain-containing protein [Minisyncoccales bacterium]